MRKLKAPEVVVRRLALYLRLLQGLGDEGGERFISSKELGEKAGVNSAQVRKDLALFGEFGKQGVGYEVGYLREELRSILNANRTVNISLVGAGELGTAVSRYNLRRFAREKNYPFRLVACFDTDPAKIGKKIDKVVEIFPLSDIPAKIRDLGVEMAIITVPAEAAQEVADKLVAGGIKAILNFAPVKLFVPSNIRLQVADVSLELQQLAYYLDR
ncbi:MAG: redox-sensing transcriptional repressor Rex [Bacillota bacterium]